MRVKRGTTINARHKRLLAKTKGFRASRGNHIKAANEAILHAGQHAYNDRRRKKRTMRTLWITRLSAASRAEGLPYSRMVAAFKTANIALDRKVLSEIAATDPKTFTSIIAQVKTTAAVNSKA